MLNTAVIINLMCDREIRLTAPTCRDGGFFELRIEDEFSDVNLFDLKKEDLISLKEGIETILLMSKFPNFRSRYPNVKPEPVPAIMPDAPVQVTNS